MRAISYVLPESKSAAALPCVVECPIPQVRAGEVLVKVHYAGLNHFEIATSKGQRNNEIVRAQKKANVVSGIEMAGVVKSDGRRFKQDDRVVGYTHIFKGPFFHAEYVAVPEENLALIPENLSLEGAVSLVGGALTSINALERISKTKAGEEVLVTGATGSVGVTGVQLATHLGANVSAICHSTQADFVQSQGATKVYAYDRQSFPSKDARFDLIYDTAPSLSFSIAKNYLNPHGRYITTMPHLDIVGLLKSLFSMKKWGYLMEYDTDQVRMERFRILMEEGCFLSVIDSVFKLENVTEAFKHQLQPGKKGKILIDLQ